MIMSSLLHGHVIEITCFSIYHTSLIANSQIAILFPTKVGKNWVRAPFCFTGSRREVNST